MIDWLRDIPDPRHKKNLKHELAEVLVCTIMGFINGKTRLRRIIRWSKSHINELRKYMPFPNGIPSLSTFSRTLNMVDEELLSITITNWIGEIINTRGGHIAIDGKGLRAAARKISNQRTPYIVNALDVATKLVVGQLAIPEKTNEMTAIPELISMLELENSLVTIDAIGATENIMNTIHENKADFLIQVKGNCPELYREIVSLFSGLEVDKNDDKERFNEKYGEIYSEENKKEKNRERYEYRKYQVYNKAEGIEGICEIRPYIKSVGIAEQTRILIVKDADGNDITPELDEFLEKGSVKQPKPVSGDKMGDDIQKAGLIASRTMTAKEMMESKRSHWAVENNLHYVLDESFGEDKCTIRKGRNTVSALRKMAYNIIRLIQLLYPERSPHVPDIIDDINDDFNMGARMIFEPILSLY